MAIQNKELLIKISSYENSFSCEDEMKRDKEEAETIKVILPDLEQQYLILQKEQREADRADKRNGWISIFPAFCIAVLMAVISGFQLTGIIISVLLLAAGAAACQKMNKKVSAKRQKIQDKLNCIQEKKTEVKNKQNLLLQKYGYSRMEELSGKLEEMLNNYYRLAYIKKQQKDLEARMVQQEDHRDAVYDAIMKYAQNFISAEEISSEMILSLQEEMKRRKLQVALNQEDMNRQLEICRLNIEKLRWEISSLEKNEEKLILNQERYQELEEQQKKNEAELEAVKLALSAIQELSADIHDSFGHQLNQAVSNVIGEITQNKYTELKVNEKLEVKLEWNGSYLPLERLSAGTIDQVYFALRLAVSDLLLNKEQVTLLLDDSFALYDDTRVRSALTWLANREQIVLFTCHRREQRLLEELHIPCHFIDLSVRA